MPRQAAYGVFEVGMNHPGEIRPLTALVRPHVAIVTAIAESHLGHFSGLAAIADAKAEIFGGVEPGGACLINGETPFHERLEQAARRDGLGRVYRFGARPDADVRLIEADFAAEHSAITVSVFGERLSLRIGAPGRHIALNVLAVLGAVKLCGADLDAAAAVLSSLAPGKGRGLRLRLPLADGAVTLIDESYNANPASMRAALALLARAELGPGGSESRCSAICWSWETARMPCIAPSPRTWMRPESTGFTLAVMACPNWCRRCRVGFRSCTGRSRAIWSSR